MIGPTRGSRYGRDRGSAAVELVLVAPLLVLVMLVVVAVGLLVDARLVVSDAAHQAARAASLARTDTVARGSADRAASQALREAGAACTQPRVRLATGHLAPGATVTAHVSCTADLGRLTGTGLPGRVQVEGTAYSVVDTYRSLP
ncbi:MULTISPECIES: TadE/TadG family type IV pilus assembly protein [unclassified Streptomyces]|uniref:TadE/TadG family type IV pilus assembly protein n=1 Tax=unclassified Streptomyces TaxID=2593676 RepID=UPI002B1DEC96|nr:MULTISPECIES: TadE/TadG family type IV pilus assembly protein [unclassified Streptomyces]